MGRSTLELKNINAKRSLADKGVPKQRPGNRLNNVSLPDNPTLPPEDAPPDERFDRQVRIPGWNQGALARARVGVVGDDPWLTGLFVTAAAALGINRLTVVAPDLDQRLRTAAQGLNPELDLAFFPGYFSHFLLEELLAGCTVLVDTSRHALAVKLLFTYAHRAGLPLVRGHAFEDGGARGLKLFTYQKGREWQDLLQILPQAQLPDGTDILRKGARRQGPLPLPSNSFPQPYNSGAQASSPCCTGKMPVLPGNGGWEGGLGGDQGPQIPGLPPPTYLSASNPGDPVLALVMAGLVLEETKKLLLGEPVTPEVISYVRSALDQSGPPHPNPPPPAGGKGEKETPVSPLSSWGADARRTWTNSSGAPDCTAPETEIRKPQTAIPLAIVGAGALGNFVGLGLASLGFTRLTFIDPDPVEVTNLNRQILFWDAVGQSKAEALAARLSEWFGVAARAETSYVTRDSNLSAFAAIFDCTDNHQSRIVLSEKCRESGQVLISGGTGVAAGQVVIFNPAAGGPTPAELLGLYDIVGRREIDVRKRQRASCVYAPEPAVIMTNQIIGGLMVDAFRRLLAGENPPNLFYDAHGEKMLS